MLDDRSDKLSGAALGRELSTRIVLWHQAIADRLGLNATEHKCLDLLHRHGAMTAGQLADLSGLSTGAVTKVVDSLLDAELVKRERSAGDRRQVIIQPNMRQESEIAQIFASLEEAMHKVMMRYNEEQLAAIQDYLSETIHILKEETAKLREDYH